MNKLQRKFWIMELQSGDKIKWHGVPLLVKKIYHCSKEDCNRIGKIHSYEECEKFRILGIVSATEMNLVVCCKEIEERL